MLFAVGCGAPAATPEPITPTPVPPTPVPPTPTTTPEPTGISISGVITNMEDVDGEYLAEDSYLQLVRLPDDGQLSFSTDDQGRLAYDSELAQIQIPQDGAFTFQVESLESGAYLIAAQRLLASSLMMPLLVQDDLPVTFEIPQNVNLPLAIDLGEVTIPLPNP